MQKKKNTIKKQTKRRFSKVEIDCDETLYTKLYWFGMGLSVNIALPEDQELYDRFGPISLAVTHIMRQYLKEGKNETK